MTKGQPQRRNPVILLVEDNPTDIQITRRGLREIGSPAELVVARDGQEAYEYLQRQSAAAAAMHDQEPSPAAALPALILLDLNLPRVTGRELLQRIRGTPALAAIPVVVLTTSILAEDVQAGYAHGANTYIEKPQDFNRFVEVLRLLHQYWFETALLPPS